MRILLKINCIMAVTTLVTFAILWAPVGFEYFDFIFTTWIVLVFALPIMNIATYIIYNKKEKLPWKTKGKR